VAAGNSLGSPSSKTGGATPEELNLRKGNVFGALGPFGDWLKKYERIGELPGDGITPGCELIGPVNGVCNSDGELAEPEEEEDMEPERPLGPRKVEVAIGIGSECLTLLEGLLDLFEDMIDYFAEENAGEGKEGRNPGLSSFYS
jgi:hypothetical protein